MLLGAMLRTLERVVCAAAEQPADVRRYWERPEVNRGREDWPVAPSRQFTALVDFFNTFGLQINVEVFSKKKLATMIARGPKKPTMAEIWARYVCDAFAEQPGRKHGREMLAHDYEFNLCVHALPVGRRTFNNVSAFIHGFVRALYPPPHSSLMRVVVKPTDYLDYVAFSVSIKPRCHYRMEFETTRDASIILRIWSCA